MMHTLRFLSKSRSKSKGKSSKTLQSSGSLTSLIDDHNATPALPTTKPPISSGLAASTIAPEAGTNSSIESFLDGVAQSFYTTPPRSTAQSQLGSDAGKDDAPDEPEYALVRPVDEKPQENEWTQLELAPVANDSAARKSQDEVDAAVRQALDEAEARIHDIEQKHADELRVVNEERAAERKQTELLKHALDRDKALFADERATMKDRIQTLEAELESVRGSATSASQTAEERAQNLEGRLAEARRDIDAKSRTITHLQSNITRLQSEVDHLHSQTISLTDEASAAKQTLRDETKRLQRLVHDEQSRAEQRVDGALAQVKELEKKNEKLRHSILELEDTSVHVEEEARSIRTTNKDLRSLLARYEAKMAEDKVLIDEKNGRLDMLSKSSTFMTAELVQMQEAVNATNRQNRMLVDQLRQQSSDMLASKGLNRPSGHLAKIGRGFQGGNTTRVDAAVRTANILNEEVFQLCASMTDQLESIAKRFVAGTGGGRPAPAAENLKPLIGTELVRYLQRQALDASPVAESRLAIIQVALQGCLIACCMRIITSWYPNDWEYGDFLAAVYERIRGALGEGPAAGWRETTMKCCARASDSTVINKLTTYLASQVEDVITVSGWAKDEKIEQIMKMFLPKLREITTLAARLNGLISTGAVGELECRVLAPGATFDPVTMDNHDKPLGGSRQSNRGVIVQESVVCTIALGLSTSDVVGGGPAIVHMKPQVVLYGSLW